MANFNEAFNYIVKDKTIYSASDLQNDKCYIKTDKETSDKYSKYQKKNYRYKENPNYQSKIEEIYNYQGINDGKGPGKNINLDDELTRSNFHVKPLDKLSESIKFDRYINPELKKCIDYNDKPFLVSTSQSCQPQKGYNAKFEIYGKSDRDYNRKPFEYYKK